MSAEHEPSPARAPGARAWPPALALALPPVLALVACAWMHLAFGHSGLNMADESFLWYGVRRTVAGEVPLRDFQSYEPGRYWWCSAFAPLVGDGIVGVRLAITAFAALGLTLGLLVARRFARHAGELVVVAALLALWMFPRHKLFEPAMAMAALWFAVRMVERPSAGRHLAAGAFAGLATILGRNHALYCGVAFGLLWAYLAWRVPAGAWRRLGALALGVVAGVAPFVLLLLVVPGLAGGFWYSMEIVLKHGSNLPIPYPFPWRTDWSGLEGWRLAGEAAVAAAFLLPFVLVPAGLVAALRTPASRLAERAVPIAATVVGGIYLHHAAVRSDAVHLGQCVQPLLLSALALSGTLAWRRARTLAWGALAALTVLVAWQANPLVARHYRAEEFATAPFVALDEELELPLGQALELESIVSYVQRNVPREETLWIVNRPGLYALLDRAAPTWWLTFYYEADEAEQEELIAELEADDVAWVLVADGERFMETHRTVLRHLAREFEPVALRNLPPTVRLLRRRG